MILRILLSGMMLLSLAGFGTIAVMAFSHGRNTVATASVVAQVAVISAARPLKTGTL